MKRKPDEPKGSPAWMNTFADLMNLLLCFFVLLFSMSTVDAEKFEKMVASFQNTFSILPNGGSSIGDGTLISSGVSQLEMLDSYYKDKANSESDQETDEENDVVEEYKEQALEESEKMSEQLEDAIARYGIQDQVGRVLGWLDSLENPQDNLDLSDKQYQFLRRSDFQDS